MLQEALRADPDMLKAKKLLKNLNKFSDCKERANGAFKHGKYTEAIEKYSECLELDPEYRSYNSIIYCNRAAGKNQSS